MMLNKMTYCFIFNAFQKGDTRTVLIVLSFIAITILPIYAGQLMRNQGVKFHILLARLYNTMIIIGEITLFIIGSKSVV